jgi:hypothetical protein
MDNRRHARGGAGDPVFRRRDASLAPAPANDALSAAATFALRRKLVMNPSRQLKLPSNDP